VSNPSAPRLTNRWIGPGLALVSFLIAGSLATVVYQRWRSSDARELTSAQQDHIVSFSELSTHREVELLSFPATERFEDVPRFKAQLNEWRVRERPFSAEPKPDVFRVVAVGESSTFGTGLAPNERFTDLLGEQLEERHPGCCEVLNAGRMGMTTPTAVRFVKEEVAAWRPSVLIYDTMANDLADRDQAGMVKLSAQKLEDYEARLTDLVAFCKKRNIRVVFWANTIARTGDLLMGFKVAMRRVASSSGAGYVDLGVLYAEAPATPEEIEAFLAEPNWTQWFDVIHPPELALERVALHIDWVHPNRFGSKRLAAGLLPLVEHALELEVR